MLPETETELPKTEELMHEPSMEKESDHEEQSDPEKDGPDEHSCSVDIFYNDQLDFLEVQRINNIMRAAYKEFMEIAIKAKPWIFDPPPLGSVEDLQEMFHTPPPHGSTVECSVQSAILPISSRLLISLMMDGERWASMFSNIICSGSDDNNDVLTPLKKFWSTGYSSWEVILLNAQFRLPAEFLPRWSTRFLRFKTTVMDVEDTYAIFDVSTDYFENTTADSTQKIEYKRRPSGVIIRPCGLLSEVIWIENAEVQKIDIPKNMSSTFTPNFHLTARQWISIISQNLKRRHSKILTTEMFDECIDIPDLLTIGDKLRKFFLETVNPFPTERTCDLFSDDKIRILRDVKASSIGYRNDFIATSTVRIAETPTRLLTFLDIDNATFQWTSIKSQAQLKLAAAFLTTDESSCTSLSVKIETGDDEDFMGHKFFLQESTENEYCSFVLSSQMTEADVHIALLPRFCRNSLFLRPSGFAVMPAGPGGLQSEASFVTIYLRRELKNMEVDRVIEAMSWHMNAVIDRISNTRLPYIIDEDIEQNTPNQ
ncbi:homeobox-leucine zipper protein PROTODERMAL FACTOR 2-like [Benincasa hispida]|uniref:homeobox-leucine zipper protein PROTODERMAL FACTOR 2-like n=1 Tax=Benincasa hispida TaxID=102211 RepID=UPI0018FF6AA3|nr:homeobox-leucine zipper protein PROTODERMAL FACTOR 2-like [Benincasa hispida]